jgi:mono/diheme cytochrome c family protein/uncharacterized protein YoxC
MGLDERHYNINTLNKLFAIVSLVLLTAIGLLFFNDYARAWKEYQSNFQDLEIENTRVKYDGEVNQLNADPQYQKLQNDLQGAKDSYAVKCSEQNLKQAHTLEKDLSTRSEIKKQQYRVTKAQFDAAKFHYEEAVAHHDGDVKVAKIHYQSLEQKTKQLNQSIEQLSAKSDSNNKIFTECEKSVKEIERQERALAQKANILSRKLKKIDPNEMTLINRIANIVRNLPIIDLANPTYKIRQIVLKDVREDNNFLSLPTVDRCTTCHLGIDNPDYKDAPQPLRTHPNLELFAAKDSAHSIEEFGCTVCHNGRGRGTDFTSAAHTPSSDEQAKDWKEKYGWQEMHHWDKPMFPKQYVEAGCFKCHSGQTTIKGAEKLNLGLNLIERAGCYACHNIDKYKDWPKPGPSLQHIAAKTTKEWVLRWLADPKAFRHTTWMPSYFDQSKTNDPESKIRSQQEISAIVEYLFDESENYKFKELLDTGDVKKGEELVAAVGCFGCHVKEEGLNKSVRDRNRLKQEQGPNLVGFGNKTSSQWIYDWLKDPQRYHPQTRMPNLRLSDQEAADIAAYLSNSTNDVFNEKPIPEINDEVLTTIVFDFLKKSFSQEQAKNKTVQMSRQEKLTFAGKKLIARYGCFSCHDIAGFDGYKPIGTDLTEEGSKTVDKFDFGFVKIDHSKQAWIHQKLKNPRIFDTDKIKAADEKLMMPNYNFTDLEAQAITTALLGFVKDNPGKIKPRSPENLTIEKGQQIVRQFNCQGCHIIEDEGGVITNSVNDWLITYQGKEKIEAQTMVKTFSPPKLMGIGKKVQAQWLFDFLHQPQTVRPWLSVRMPTYNFNAAHLNIFLKYFNALDKEEFPFTEHVNTSLTPDELISAQKMFSKDYFDCTKCHVVGAQLPAGSQETWAPNLELAGKRLKPEWVNTWLRNPSAVDSTTKMPTFFDPQNFEESGPPDILNGDENEQIRVLRNYIMSLSNGDHSTQSKPTPVKQTVTPTEPSE